MPPSPLGTNGTNLLNKVFFLEPRSSLKHRKETKIESKNDNNNTKEIKKISKACATTISA